MSIAARGVSWTAGGRLVVDAVTLEVDASSTLGLLGPNGSGKSSLLRLLAAIRRPVAGSVLLDGRDTADLSRRAVARRLAVVEQQAETDTDLTVLEVVRLGRVPHRRPWAGDGPDDDAAVLDAVAATGLSERLGQRYSTLSGGERQRVQIARALAQQPRELLLDEPTNHLDIAHQHELMALVADLPITTVVALHDLDLAAAYCDRLVVLDAGAVVAGGSPSEVLTPELIRRVWGVEAEVSTHGPDAPVSVRVLPRARRRTPSCPDDLRGAP